MNISLELMDRVNEKVREKCDPHLLLALDRLIDLPEEMRPDALRHLPTIYQATKA